MKKKEKKTPHTVHIHLKIIKGLSHPVSIYTHTHTQIYIHRAADVPFFFTPVHHKMFVQRLRQHPRGPSRARPRRGPSDQWSPPGAVADHYTFGYVRESPNFIFHSELHSVL